MKTGNLVALHTGERVDSASEEWRRECFERWKCAQHLLGLRRATKEQRLAYLMSIESTRGVEFARRVRQTVEARWAEVERCNSA